MSIEASNPRNDHLSTNDAMLGNQKLCGRSDSNKANRSGSSKNWMMSWTKSTCVCVCVGVGGVGWAGRGGG